MCLNKITITCYCFSIYIFISELTLPFKFFFNDAISVWVISFLVLILSISLNLKSFFNRKNLAFAFVFFNIFLVNYFITDNDEVLFYFGFNFIKFVFIPVLMFLAVKDYNKLFETLRTMSIVCVIILVCFVNEVSQRGDSGFMNYMEYGNGLAKCFVFIAISLMVCGSNKLGKLLYSLLLLGILLLVLFYGSRGAFLSILLFLFFYYFFKNPIITKGKILAVITIPLLLLFIYFNVNYIISFIFELSNSLGISSYSIAKLKMASDNGIGSSIGERAELVTMALSFIYDNYGLPRGVTYFTEVTGLNYPHNLLLDIALNFSVFAVVALIMYLLYGVFILKKNNDVTPFLLIFIFSFTTLLFSQTFWFNTLFWIYPAYQLLRYKGGIQNTQRYQYE